MQTLNNTMDYILGLGKKKQNEALQRSSNRIVEKLLLCVRRKKQQEINAEVAFFKEPSRLH